MLFDSLRFWKGGFIQTPVLLAIVVGVLVISSAGYFGVNQYLENKNAEEALRLEEKKQLEEELSQQETSIADLESKLTELIDKPDPKPQVIYQATGESSNERSVADITKEWSPLVTSVYCWSLTRSVSGSGSVSKYINDGGFGIRTNKHLVSSGGFGPNYCEIYFLNGEKYTVENRDIHIDSNYDIADLKIDNLSKTIKNFNRIDDSLCRNEPSIGDGVVVLGYPAIGSSSGITVTEGIISGYDGVYYITSAKIDNGNSGGIAVSVKNNCVLGMPTASVGGGFESLGRIQKNQILLYPE